VIALALSLATSVVTMWSMKLAGDKSATAWLISLANQGLWAMFILVYQAWGLVPLNVALSVIYWRNWRAWRAAE
jgi:hypothetical protein